MVVGVVVGATVVEAAHQGVEIGEEGEEVNTSEQQIKLKESGDQMRRN